MPKKKHPEHVNLERWLVSYADFITLLFAFFVILYASAKTDAARFKAVSDSIKKAFGVRSGGTIDLQGSSGGTQLAPFEEIEESGGRAVDLPAGKTNTAAESDPSLQEVREKLEEAMHIAAGPGSADSTAVVYDARGIVVRMTAADIFAPGQSEVKLGYRPLLEKIGKVAAEYSGQIRIEGFTDLDETKDTVGFSSAWELSSSRAIWVAQYWIDRFKEINPKQVSIAGFGAFRPLSTKRDEWSRGANRRVEIVFVNPNKK